MTKAKINYWVDVGLAISFIAVSVTGVLKLRRVMGWLGWQWQDPLVQTLSKIHDWSGIVMVLLVLVHLVLHWDWIVRVTKCVFDKECDVEKQ